VSGAVFGASKIIAIRVSNKMIAPLYSFFFICQKKWDFFRATNLPTSFHSATLLIQLCWTVVRRDNVRPDKGGGPRSGGGFAFFS